MQIIVCITEEFMCTAISFQRNGDFFGRTLDAAMDYGGRCVLVPRFSVLSFSGGEITGEHYALLGVGIIEDDIPLLFDAMNEWGLCGAGLSFPSLAKYERAVGEKKEIASYELILKILATSKSIAEVRGALSGAKITDSAINERLAPTPMHWIFSDCSGAVTVEQTENGLSVYENAEETLSNSPDFPFHERRYREFSALSPKNPDGDFLSLGYGAFGLPGDFASSSRFVRASYMRKVAECKTPADFFRAIDTVSIPKGAVIDEDGKAHYTTYTSCYDTRTRTLYKRTYPSADIRSVSLTNDGKEKETVQYI